MKITICGSIAFIDDMLELKQRLEKIGHKVKTPPSKIQDNNGNTIDVKDYYIKRKAASASEKEVWDMKEKAMLKHFEKVEWCDAILVLNINKKDIKGYIGANTLIEMGIAQYLGKKIYLWNDIPNLPCAEELLGMKPSIINQNINLLN